MLRASDRGHKNKESDQGLGSSILLYYYKWGTPPQKKKKIYIYIYILNITRPLKGTLRPL